MQEDRFKGYNRLSLDEESSSAHDSHHGRSGSQELNSEGSSVVGASINFVNCIVGAGCIGFGNALAASGGIPGIVTMLFCAWMSKLSFDLLIQLTIDIGAINSSYEEIGASAYGRRGRLLVLLSKGVFCFGALSAIVVIVRDNFAPPLQHLLGYTKQNPPPSPLFDDKLSTVLLSLFVMLPMCLFRDIAPFERFSVVKIFTFTLIIAITAYMFVTLSSTIEVKPTEQSDFYVHWLQLRPGLIPSMGTFIFTFISQHTVHLVYRSLRTDHKNIHDWNMVSSLAVGLSLLLVFPIGLFPYLTYWEDTTSNLFMLYPPVPLVDVSRILLCCTMLLTFPPPFFSCRELIVISLPHTNVDHVLPVDNENAALIHSKQDQLAPWLLPGSDRQLRQPFHTILTASLLAVVVFLAISAPSLGDVLNLVGCGLGTLIAFVLPGLFAMRLQGYTHTAMFLVVVGGILGLVGTYFSLLDLIHDLNS